MKNLSFSLLAITIFGVSTNAQTNTVTPAPTAAPAPTTTPAPKTNNFDKKFRFGLRVAAQPTWFTTNDKNTTPIGAKFGAGFGLNMEFRLSDVVAVSTGIGGDFESGKYGVRYDSQNNYTVLYWQDNAAGFVAPKNGGVPTDIENSTNTGYLLKDRTIKTTFVTIPVLLKLSTAEYSGLKYFGMFGAELGIRVKTVANDNYYDSYKYSSAGVVTATTGATSQSNINLGSDGSLIPARIGLNVGLGTEYRLGGTTSAFVSVNYFRSFTNLLHNTSKYLVYNYDPTSSKYSFVNQNLILNAIRINLGILF